MGGGSANGRPSPRVTAVPGTRFARVEWFDELDSTNRWVADQAREGATEGLVAIARHQTAGRGRLDRRWEAPVDSALLLSALVRPTVPRHRWPLYTVALALAVVDATEALGASGVALKWPNDVIAPAFDDRKLAGILCEAAGGAVVAGVGVNRVRPGDVPPVLAERAVWLADLVQDGRVPELPTLATELLRRFDATCGLLEASSGALLGRYRDRCATLGTQVRVIQPDGELTGRATMINDDGHLVVRLSTGGRVTVAAGDVVHVRPVDGP